MLDDYSHFHNCKSVRQAKPVCHSHGAFTLIELLVALTILSIVVALVSNITNSATRTIAGSSSRLGADLEGRAVLDRMSLDFAKMIKRSDIQYLFDKKSTASGNGNDAIGFFSESQGYGTDVSPYSQVEYRMGMGRTTAMNAPFSPGMLLGRASQGLPWDIGMTFSQTNGFNSAINYQVAGDLVFRMEYTFLMKGVNGAAPRYNDDPFAGVQPADRIKDISGIVVAIAVMDQTAREKLVEGGSENDWATLINRFPDAHGNSDILSRWYPVVNGEPAAAGGIPVDAVRNIRIYQRTFPVNGR